MGDSPWTKRKEDCCHEGCLIGNGWSRLCGGDTSGLLRDCIRFAGGGSSYGSLGGGGFGKTGHGLLCRVLSIPAEGIRPDHDRADGTLHFLVGLVISAFLCILALAPWGWQFCWRPRGRLSTWSWWPGITSEGPRGTASGRPMRWPELRLWRRLWL